MKRLGLLLGLGWLIACGGPGESVSDPHLVTRAQAVAGSGTVSSGVSFLVQGSSNDWWMQARVVASPVPERVEVSVDGGAWTALSHASWDVESWSLGEHFGGRRVRLRAVQGSNTVTSCELPYRPGLSLPTCSSGGVSGPSLGFLHTQGSRLYAANGQPVRLTGLSWFGFEGSSRLPYGLDKRPLGVLLDQVKGLGYNMLRLPFSNDILRPGVSPDPAYLSSALNPGLRGLTSLQVLDRIIAEAKLRGLRVVLDRHCLDSSCQSDLWYRADRVTEEAAWIEDWKMLARRYRGDSTVVGVDLHNEPHGRATWGDGNLATDWRLAAERAGNAILAENPDLLILVEGIEQYQGTWYWWGGNLRGARTAPVRLSVAGRLVYSAHDYPNSVYPEPWFQNPGLTGYPTNLPGVWDSAWGYLVKEDLAPVWLGEFGTKLETELDRQWLQALTQYLSQNQMGFAFWALNPNSGDTGGVLKDDWITPQSAKQAWVAPALAPLIP